MATQTPVLSPLEKRADRGTLVLAGSVLSMASGMVNMYAFFELGVLLSHHTGNTCHLSRQVEISLVVKLIAACIGFPLGAAAAGYAKLDFDSFLASGRSAGLAVAGATVLVGTLIQWQLAYTQWQLEYPTTVAIFLLAFSQGLQNGITTACKAMPVRTTHMTGAFTDFGMIMGSLFRAKLEKTSAPNPWKPSLLFLCVAFFGVGGFIEKKAIDSIGTLAGLVPATLLMLSGVGAVLGPIVVVSSRRQVALLLQQKQEEEQQAGRGHELSPNMGA